MTDKEALILALEALKEISRYATTPWEDEWCGELADETLTAINALAQPAQEPVHQWREKHSSQWWDGYPDNEDGGGPYETRTLYTTPPQRPWVSLTDDQIKEIVGPWGDTPIKGYTRKLIDQIDAKLRENNT
jgi:hypothetical protein